MTTTNTNTTATGTASTVSGLSSSMYPLFTIDQHKSIPAGKPVIPGVLSRNSVAFLYGESGTFKSFIAMGAALGIASGQGAWGRKAEQGITVYIAGEGQHGLNARVSAWLKATGSSSTIPFLLGNQAVNMLDTSSLDALIVSLQQVQSLFNLPISLVIFDTLATCFGDGDENLSRDVRKYMESCARIAKAFDCAVLTVHHQGKDTGRGLRGHSSLRANADTVIRVRRGDQPGTVSTTVEKQKDGREFTSTFRLDAVDLGVDAEGLPLSSLVAVHVEDVGLPGQPARAAKPLPAHHLLALDVLKAAGPDGLTSVEWRKAAKAVGVGAERASAFDDARKSLTARNLVSAVDDRFIAVEALMSAANDDEDDEDDLAA
ncbi:AAA family ATPase [Azospirillum doebereinerae]|uniref:AAA family ATPase n=1 Tax=Azospirillum doebereinerae TaxID=92933 RepID=UPI001EE61FC6|nr:AAA family ATPase [Azospirillum doebereinerae]MCG5239328.1 helicase RepA family protein [Azospirillum doebereinerae]